MQSETIVIPSDSDDEPEQIDCPVCGTGISHLSEVDRNDHVAECVERPLKRANTEREKPPRPPEAKKKPRREKPPIPGVKRLRFGALTVAVDAFCYRYDADVRHYFLSHFHSDHYGGISGKWDHGTIYCSALTGSLLESKFKVSRDRLVCLENETEYSIAEDLRVTCIDANHCPGSQIFLFKTSAETVLHCGDFRVSRAMLTHPLLQTVIHRCYLDTTYLDPVYSFPKQDEVVGATSRFVARLKAHESGKVTQRRITDFFVKRNTVHSHLVVVGTYTIGKERLAVEIARALDTKIYCARDKMKVMRQLDGMEGLLSEDPRESRVHLASMQRLGDLEGYFRDYSDTFEKVIGVRPTGWSFRSATSTKWMNGSSNTEILERVVGHREQMDEKLLADQYKSSKVAQVYSVPYSEHSSFRELVFFIKLLDIRDVIPTVNLHRLAYLEGWIRSIRALGSLDIEDF